MKQTAKRNKTYGKVEDEFTILANVQEGVMANIKKLKEEIFMEEGMYARSAKDKVEKKLKKGMDNEPDRISRILEGLESKKENTKNAQTIKIDTWTSEIERKKTETEAKIEKLQRDLEAFISERTTKINTIEKKIESDETTYDYGIKYHRDLLEKCYVDVPVVVTYPPSHFKKIETLSILEKQYAFRANQILQLKALSYDEIERSDPAEEMKRKYREQARKEDQERLKEAEDRQIEEESRQNLERKAQYEADKARRKQRDMEREEEWKMKVLESEKLEQETLAQ